MARIEFEKVSFAYAGSSEQVIRDMSFVIADGEAHALLGASGAGKTTLLNLLSGLLRPSSGRILLNDKEVTHLDGFARCVSQVFQFPVVYEGLTVAENLQVPMRSSGLGASERSRRVAWLVAELGLEAVLQQKPARLSLFQKQLLSVGKALARKDVAVVLLDEPLTAVEPKVKWALRQTLRRVQAETQVTMVYVTHDQTEALTFADRVSLLTAHGLAQTGTPRELYESPVDEYVARFVGSPGMNLLPLSDLLHERLSANQTDVHRIGFRPEWATVVDETADFRARVVGVKSLGTKHGQKWGEIKLRAKQDIVTLVGHTQIEVESDVNVRLNRWVAFRAGHFVGSHGF